MFGRQVKRGAAALCLLAVTLAFACGAGALSERPVFFWPAARGAFLHVSIDDTIGVFQNLTEQQDRYESIFDEPTLRICKDLHDRYGMVFSFYCFYETDSFSLAQATDAFRAEFVEHAAWMKFGFHAQNATAYQDLQPQAQADAYQRTLRELERITGSQQCIETGFLRLDRYTASAEVIEALQSVPGAPQGLLCAEPAPPRQSYDLTPAEQQQMYAADWYERPGGLCYTPTDIRVEFIENPVDFYQQLHAMAPQTVQIVFTHETQLQKTTVQKYLHWFGMYAEQMHCDHRYPQYGDGGGHP